MNVWKNHYTVDRQSRTKSNVCSQVEIGSGEKEPEIPNFGVPVVVRMLPYFSWTDELFWKRYGLIKLTEIC